PLRECPACRGSGAEPGSRVLRCHACGGSGEVLFQSGFLRVSRPCSVCGGTGKKVETSCKRCAGQGLIRGREEILVRLPPGIEDGAVRTLPGSGHAGRNGGPPGHLHVRVVIDPHPIFRRDGANLLVTVPISFPEAVLGTQIEVPTLDGKYKLGIPAGTPSGTSFRLEGKGFPVLGGAGRGDQIVTVVIEVPKELTRKQRKLVEELAVELGESAHPEKRSFFEKLRGLFG
ncbi:MAG: molecular chaperone DnaJ, partial [Sandaracinaceae bacterium]|nr:molecular chaperone DnaJ [Sandaracinaceae bacterium]